MILGSYSSVDIRIGGDSAVGEDGARLPEAAVQQAMLKFTNAYLDNLNPKTEADFKLFYSALQKTRQLIGKFIHRQGLGREEKLRRRGRGLGERPFSLYPSTSRPPVYPPAPVSPPIHNPPLGLGGCVPPK